jgi:hypothetical protein
MNLKKFKHVILTRFNTKEDDNGLLLYDKEGADEWMAKRMPLFEETKRSVLAQTEADFEWVISIDERTPKKYVRKIFTDPRITLVNCNIMEALSEVETRKPWIITTRLDCDDMLMPGAVHAIQRKFQPQIMVIDVRVVRLDYATKKVYLGDVGNGRSMFISLVEPAERAVGVFCRPHSMVQTGYPMKGSFKEGFGQYTAIPLEYVTRHLAVMVCHDHNVANKIKGQPIGELKDFM